MAAASVDGRVALGPRAGARVRRCGDPPEDVTPATLGLRHAHAGGFDLHAGLVVRAGQRDRLERVCRYALRPHLAQERLHRTSEGEIWLTLRHRWADGTTHLRFDPLELLERLAALTPRPRVNLI
ncbi:MAG: transposase, partial [Acidobacteria bacterium]|nr:transposase [Acidobacteriota bacterium]